MPNALNAIVRAARYLIGADGILRRPGTEPEDLAIVKNVGGGAAPVRSVATRTGDIVLTTADIGGLGSAATHAFADFDPAGAADAVSADLTNYVNVGIIGVSSSLTNHIQDLGNPHEVDYRQVGLGETITGHYNVLHYGAVGDGIADDTAALNDALAAIPAGGGVLYVPLGTYKTTGGFTSNKPIIIEGLGSSNGRSGTDLVVIESTSNTVPLFTLTNPLSEVRNITLRCIAGTTPVAGCHGLYFNSADVAARPVVDKVTVKGFWNNIDVNVGTSAIIHGVQCIGAINYGLRLDNAINKDWGDCTVDDCFFWSNGTNAPAQIRWEGGGGLRIINNKVVDCIGNGVSIFVGAGVGTGQLIITGNSIDQVSGNGIRIESDPGALSFTAIVIDSNYIDTRDVNEPIYISSGADGTLSGFIINDNSLIGSACVGKPAITIAGNHGVQASIGINPFSGVCTTLYTAGVRDSVVDRGVLNSVYSAGTARLLGPVSMGLQVGTNVAGSHLNQSLKIFDDNSINTYGIGVIPFELEYQVPAASSHGFYVNSNLVGSFGASGFSSPKGITVSTGNTPVTIDGSIIGTYTGFWAGSQAGTNAGGTNFFFLVRNDSQITILNSLNTVNFRVNNNDVAVVTAGAFTVSVPINAGFNALSAGAATFNGAVSIANRITSGVVPMAYAATLTVDASLGNQFNVTLTAAIILGNPTNAVDGQGITYCLTQNATGGWGVTLGSAFNDPTGATGKLRKTANKREYLSAVYNSTTAQWDVMPDLGTSF